MKDKFKIIQNVVEKELGCSAHNMDHVLRVYNLAIHLAKDSNADMNIVRAATLLHDIARLKEDNDATGKTDHAVLGAKLCVPILKKANFPNKKIKHVQDCIRTHRYRTGNEPQTIEAKILFDADKLDAAGAIGVARAFVWVGRNNARIYSDVDIDKYITENLGGKINGRISDKTKHSPQIEFQTKLKFLSKKLYTDNARKICKERMQFYNNFLERLEKEVKGEI